MTNSTGLEFITRIDLQHLANGARAGISVFDKSASYIGIGQFNDERLLVLAAGGVATAGPEFKGRTIRLRARVNGDTATYSPPAGMRDDLFAPWEGP